MGKKVKNKEIAERLGVSSTLVSLVLNNKADQHGIRKDTQERVLTLARQMGYFDLLKDRMESSPVEEKPGVIGMIIPYAQDPFIYDLFPFLQKAFASIGLGFSIMTRDTDEERYKRLINSYKKFYTGLILVGDAADETTIRSLKASGYPFVLLEKSMSQLRLNTVCSDMTEGVRKVINYVEKLGYKNVLIISERNSSGTDENVIEVIKDTISRKEGMNKPVLFELDQFNSGNEIDFPKIEKFLRPPYSSEVMLVLRCNTVYKVMTTLRRRKVRIPQDIALISMEEGIGFDVLYSPVTCLRKPLTGMALKVANMIWSEVKNAGKSKYKRQVNISPELVIRNSCGTIN